MIADTRAEFEGYAALYDQPDLSGDIIARGAFSKKLILPDPGQVRMLYQHQAESPIGLWTDIKEDQRGLLVRGQLFLDTDQGRQTHRLIDGGALDGLSIGFKTRKARATQGGRVLTSIDLWEISVVTFPMSPTARITRIAEPGQRLPRNLLSSRRKAA